MVSLQGSSQKKKLKKGGVLGSKHICGFNTFFNDTFSYGKRGGPLHFDALDRSLCCSSNLVDGAGAAMSCIPCQLYLHTIKYTHT